MYSTTSDCWIKPLAYETPMVAKNVILTPIAAVEDGCGNIIFDNHNEPHFSWLSQVYVIGQRITSCFSEDGNYIDVITSSTNTLSNMELGDMVPKEILPGQRIIMNSKKKGEYISVTTGKATHYIMNLEVNGFVILAKTRIENGDKEALTRYLDWGNVNVDGDLERVLNHLLAPSRKRKRQVE